MRWKAAGPQGCPAVRGKFRFHPHRNNPNPRNTSLSLQARWTRFALCRMEVGRALFRVSFPAFGEMSRAHSQLQISNLLPTPLMEIQLNFHPT